MEWNLYIHYLNWVEYRTILICIGLISVINYRTYHVQEAHHGVCCQAGVADFKISDKVFDVQEVIISLCIRDVHLVTYFHV